MRSIRTIPFVGSPDTEASTSDRQRRCGVHHGSATFVARAIGGAAFVVVGVERVVRDAGNPSPNGSAGLWESPR